MDLDSAIRKVPDFPKKGILFYDVTSIFTNPEAMRYVLRKMEETYKNAHFDGIIAIESRGFVVGAPFAVSKGLPLVLARKKGKLPGETLQMDYSLEYGQATLEIHKADLPAGKNWLIVDDLIATGGTLEAVAKMVERHGSKVGSIFSIIGLPDLNYAAKLSRYNPVTLIDYKGE
jgi:adenine phosphoribosyltransferase